MPGPLGAGAGPPGQEAPKEGPIRNYDGNAPRPGRIRPKVSADKNRAAETRAASDRRLSIETYFFLRKLFGIRKWNGERADFSGHRDRTDDAAGGKIAVQEGSPCEVGGRCRYRR